MNQFRILKKLWKSTTYKKTRMNFQKVKYEMN